MSIALKIVKNSLTYTNMRVFRAVTIDSVYSAAAIADVAIADTYVDNTALNGVNYFYGVELYNATDKTRFPPVKAIVLSDFGPATSLVNSNMQYFGKIGTWGDADGYLIAMGLPVNLPLMPGIANMTSRLTEIVNAAHGTVYSQTSTEVTMAVCLFNGKVSIIPSVSNLSIYGGNGATFAIASSNMKKIWDYLIATPDKAYIDIGGYRWNIKLLTKELIQKYPDMATIQLAGRASKLPRLLTNGSLYTYIYSEVDNKAYNFAMDVNGPTFTLASGTGYAWTYIYYEYAGQTP